MNKQKNNLWTKGNPRERVRERERRGREGDLHSHFQVAPKRRFMKETPKSDEYVLAFLNQTKERQRTGNEKRKKEKERYEINN